MGFVITSELVFSVCFHLVILSWVAGLILFLSCCELSCYKYDFISFRQILHTRVAGSYCRPIFRYLRNRHTVLIIIALFYIPTKRGFFSPLSSPTFTLLECSHVSPFNKGVVKCHCGFNLHFSESQRNCAFFISVGHLNFIFGKSLFMSFGCLLTGVFVLSPLGFLCSSLILDLNTLLVAKFINIFSPSVDCLFTLFYDFLCSAKASQFGVIP